MEDQTWYEETSVENLLEFILSGNITDQNGPLCLGIVLLTDIRLTCWQVLFSCLLMKIKHLLRTLGNIHKPITSFVFF